MNRPHLAIVVALFALVGCTGSSPATSSQGEATPTASFYFTAATQVDRPNPTPVPLAGESVPTLSSFFSTMPVYPTRTPLPTRTPYPTWTASPVSNTPITGLEAYRLVDIYTDTLSAGWNADSSWGMEYDLAQDGYMHDGRAAIVASPQEDYGGLFLTVAPGASTAYRYDQTAGVRFWFSAGDDSIFLDQIAATILGSNASPYWVEGDTSVETDPQDAFFSETRLYYLGFHRELPPRTWLEVVIWLDELPYDPDYTYITGLYIKNDVGFRSTYYVDDVALIQLPSSD